MQVAVTRRGSRSQDAHRGQRVAARSGWAAAVVGVAVTLGSCSSTVTLPSTVDPTPRAIGSPAPVALKDLNQWIGDTAIISGDLSFGLGDDQLTTEGKSLLSDLSGEILSSDGEIFIGGFADGVGGFTQTNVELSERRADAVAAWLLQNYPELSSRTFHTDGYGAGGSVAGVLAVDGVSDPLRRVVLITIE